MSAISECARFPVYFEDFEPFYEDYCGVSLITAKKKKRHKPKYRWLGAKGGRGSGKSYQLATALIYNCIFSKVRAFVLRQIDHTVDQSVKDLIDEIIDENDLPGFVSQKRKIICPATGSEIHFMGIRDMKVARGFKSKHKPNIIWFEEAEAFTMDVLNIIGPSARGDNAQIWCSWNPFEELDPVYQKWFLNRNPKSYSVNYNYWNNPLFPDELETERLNDLALTETGLMTREEYNRIWRGEPLDNNPLGLCGAAAVNYCASNVIDFETASRTLEELEKKVGSPIEHLRRLLIPLSGRVAVGVDTGLHGDDPAVLVMLNETQVVKHLQIPHCTGDKLFSVVKEFVNYDKQKIINMDASNEEGIVDFLKAEGYSVNAVKFGGKAKRNVHSKTRRRGTPDLHINARNEMAFELRYLINNRLLQIPNDVLLKRQLKNYEFGQEIVNAHVVRVLEKKEKYKDRMGHSPDFFDALALAIYTPFMPMQPGLG